MKYFQDKISDQINIRQFQRESLAEGDFWEYTVLGATVLNIGDKFCYSDLNFFNSKIPCLSVYLCECL